MIENPPNTRPAWKRHRDLTPGDFVVGFGEVAAIDRLGARVGLTNTAGEYRREIGAMETLVRVPADTPVTGSLAVEVVAR